MLLCVFYYRASSLTTRTEYKNYFKVQSHVCTTLSKPSTAQEKAPLHTEEACQVFEMNVQRVKRSRLSLKVPERFREPGQNVSGLRLFGAAPEGRLSPTRDNTPGQFSPSPAPDLGRTLGSGWVRGQTGTPSPPAHCQNSRGNSAGTRRRGALPLPELRQAAPRGAGAARARPYLYWMRPFRRVCLAMTTAGFGRGRTRGGAPSSPQAGFRHVGQMFPFPRRQRKRAGRAPSCPFPPPRVAASQGSAAPPSRCAETRVRREPALTEALT